MSMKALSNLVCESSVRASEDVLSRELVRNLPDLAKGVLAYGPYVATSSEPGPSNPQRKLGTFIKEVSQFLHIDDQKSRKVLSTYLSGDFRGTKDSLKKLTSEDRYRKPLLRDIWFFYRAERLYLLQVLKEIFSHARNTDHKHSDIFEDIFGQLLKGDQLKKSLMEQLKAVLNEAPPCRESLGKYFNEDIVSTWVHVNLREIVEILQLLLLYVYNLEGSDESEVFTQDEFLQLVKLFQSHGFGRKGSTHTNKIEVDKDLSEAVGALESFLLVCLMDLPRLSSGSSLPLMKNTTELDRVIAGLGSKSDHGPVMLGWMLAHFIAEEDIGRFRSLGERAVQLKVLQTMNQTLLNSVVTANQAVAHVINSTAFGVVSVLVSAFEPSRMNLDSDLHTLMRTMLKDRRIALAFWRIGFESGIGSIFEAKLTQFPANMTDILELLESLAEASPESADEVLNCLQTMHVFAEKIENVASRELVHKGGGNQFELCASRVTQGVTIPKGSSVTSDGRFYYFQLNYDGMKYLLGETDKLIWQASQGASHLNQETLQNVNQISRIHEVLLRNGTSSLQTLGHSISKSCFQLVEKVARLPMPPLNLLANCLQSLALMARQRPTAVWERLSETGMFPYLTSGSGSGTCDVDVTPGLVGALLAQYECVMGVYPLTMAFLDLLMTCVTPETIQFVRPSIVYVIQDIFPSYRQWRFEKSSEREIFGQKILRVIKRVVLMNKSNDLQRLGIESLMSPAPNHTLLAIASTGDRVIQSLYESQSSMEGGVGVELSRSVHLALSILNILLQNTSLDNLTSLKQVLCSPPQGSKPHFILTVAHYLYHLQSCDLPLAAVNLMSTVATILPMSLLACLGSDAEAIRDILIHRLEAQTEDVLLKIAIIKFFSSCVDSQPGLIQLLIGVKDTIKVINSKSGTELSTTERAENESVELVDNSGCLSSILELLGDVGERKDRQSYELHLALVEFIYSLWVNQRILALSHLKKQPKFWDILTQPLFSSSSSDKPKLIGCILRIISSEIYTYKGQVDSSLTSILDKLFDENSEQISAWCQDNLFKNHFASMDTDDTNLTVDETKEETRKSEIAFLLSSWKSFLLVLAHDHPISVNPKQCQKISASLIKAIREQISTGNPDLRVTTALSETCLVLMQIWQTKCSEKMETFIMDQCDLLTETSLSFEQLNSRTRLAILGIASIGLKFSSFIMDKEEQVLAGWLRPVVLLVEKCLSLDPIKDDKNQIILSLCLLQNLLNRFKKSVQWQVVFHERSVVQSLLSALHHSIRSRQHLEVARHCLGILILIANTEAGCDTLLAGSDLSQMLWLPLSTIETLPMKSQWRPVFLLSLHLSTILQRNGKHRALDNSLSVVTLLQDHLTNLLMSLREGVQNQKLDLIVATTSFVTDLMQYYKQWQLHHPSSLVHFYRILCGLIHQSICFLIRPSFLSILIGQQEKHDRDNDSSFGDRARRRMSTSVDLQDGSLESTSPETTSVQNSLLEIVGSGMTMLLSLSPDLLALVTDDIVDSAAFEQLLYVGFATPSFEQDETAGLSYGTVISVCNLCIRSLTRTSDLPASPSRTASSSSSRTLTDTSVMDRRRTILVLEKSLTLVLSQSLLFLSDARYVPRDKQLLRRELSAELGSINENMRRYIHRGTKSPHPETGSSSTLPRLSKSDESFMKFVASIVQKAFK